MLKGFKDFLLRGNVVELAVAVVVGTAFSAVVTAFTSAFLKPLIQVFSGGGQFAGSFVVDGVVFDYASFVNAVITFLITAAVIYFLVVYPLALIAERRRRGEEAGPAEATDVELLTEIRDLLRDQAGRDQAGRDQPGSEPGGRHQAGSSQEGTSPTGTSPTGSSGGAHQASTEPGDDDPTPRIPHQDR